MPSFHQPLSRLFITGLGLLNLCVGTGAVLAQEKPAAANSPKLVAPIAEGQRVFSIGHSFHVWVPAIVSDLAMKAETSGHAQIGISSIGGSRVIQHWDLAPAKNKGQAALKTGKVDVLTMSPIFLPDVGIENFVTLALEHNKAIRVIVQHIGCDGTSMSRPQNVP
ncbi:MAG: hypothetical protein O3A00_28820, partial [Planctomycetota bacterium]|nr:hypothetical protein [Planctomycetota bacterium]